MHLIILVLVYFEPQQLVMIFILVIIVILVGFSASYYYDAIRISITICICINIKIKHKYPFKSFIYSTISVVPNKSPSQRKKLSRDCYYRISQNIFQSQIDFICAIDYIIRFKQEFVINNTKYLYGVVLLRRLVYEFHHQKKIPMM